MTKYWPLTENSNELLFEIFLWLKNILFVIQLLEEEIATPAYLWVENGYPGLSLKLMCSALIDIIADFCNVFSSDSGMSDGCNKAGV